MKGSRRNYAPAFKAKVALEAAREESTVTELSRKYGVHANQVRGWSPEQIAQRLRVDFPHDPSMRISHEAIYQALYVQGRGGLERELVVHLRTGRALRKPRARARRQAWAHVTPATLLSERPAEVEDRRVAGHWEGDLLIGLNRSAVATLVERSTLFTELVHLPRGEGTA